MPANKLKYLSLPALRELRNKVEENLPRYLTSDFAEQAASDDWSIVLTTPFNVSLLTGVDGNKSDLENSRIVWNALSTLPPSIASEGRIWVRLSHVECLQYSRERWIGGATGQAAMKIIQDHFFADTRTACRDDNAIGRLWWTAFVAHRALPAEFDSALTAIWKKADIRQAVVERPWISSRPRLAGAIVRTIIGEPGATASEATFRRFMRTLNARGGGQLFEVMTESETAAFVQSCLLD